VLEHQRVGKIQQQIAGNDQDHPRHQDAAADERRVQDGKQRQRRRNGHLPGRQRPRARLHGMAPVPLDIAPVIDDVGRRGRHTEQREGQQGIPDRQRLKKFAGKQQRRQDETVLDPLPGTHQAPQSAPAVKPRGTVYLTIHRTSPQTSHGIIFSR